MRDRLKRKFAVCFFQVVKKSGQVVLVRNYRVPGKPFFKLEVIEERSDMGGRRIHIKTIAAKYIKLYSYPIL
jgi:hypothetical protein